MHGARGDALVAVERAPAVLEAWSAWIDTLPAGTSASLVWTTTGTARSSEIRTIVRSERGAAHARRTAASLSAAIGAAPVRERAWSSRAPADAPTSRDAGPRSANASCFAAGPVTAAASAQLAASMERRRSGGPEFGGSTCMLICNALGGAVARVPAGATAFAHRNARFLAEFAAEWPAGASASDTANRAWVRTTADAARTALGQGAYVNYADAGLPHWRTAYWGANLSRLEAVKARVDPLRLLGGRQGV